MSTLIGITLETEPGPSGHYCKAVMCVAESLIPETIRALPTAFTSNEFIGLFAEKHGLQYEIIVDRLLTGFGIAKQPAHVQVMHTVCIRFHRLVAKIGNVANPNQSAWEKIPQAR